MKTLSAAEVIRLLNLEPHPEGGWYRQTFVDSVEGGGRPLSTAIYYLLEGTESRWHRVDAAEVWHWYGGSAMTVTTSRDGRSRAENRLGPDLAGDERPQLVISAWCWQRARSLGAWTLIGATVAPGFQFSRFEMAPPGWEPGGA
ncbi:MAG: cupin domain-containing protein [Devosia sp.]